MVVDFCDYFWGERNSGFDVLYHNMKYGLVASKELAEFLRERSSLEETYSKQLGKLAKQCGSSTSIAAANSATTNPNGAPNVGPLCTFTPLWQLLKTSCEKVAQLQLQMAQKLNEMVKDVGKYSDELARKHKVVKESESNTVEAIQLLNQTNVTLQRSKEAYFQRGGELTKLRRDGSTSNKDLERADTKFRKAAEEYRNLVEKYAQMREDFERKMTVSCRHFQEVEEGHLSQMRNFLNSYVNVLCNNYEAMGQVHVDLRQQWDDLSVDRLMDMFVVSKMTGMEKPLPVEFEEFPLDSDQQLGANTSNQLPDYLEEWTAPTSTTGKVREDGGESRKKVSNKKSFISSSKEEKKEKRSKRDSEEGGRVAGKQGSRRATSLLNLFTSSSSSSPNAQGKSKVKASGKVRPLKGGGDSAAEEPMSPSVDVVSVASGRGLGGSAPATPTEAESATNQSATGSWSRNSLRGSKYESPPRSSTSSSANTSISGLGIASWTAGFLKSRRDRRKEKDKDKNKVSKKKRDSDASSIKSDGEPNLTGSATGVAVVSGGSNVSSGNITLGGGVGSGGGGSGQDSSSFGREKERREDKDESPLYSTGDTASDSAVKVDDEGYTIRPRDETWNAEKTSGFYSSSDADSDDEPERKLHVEIKPITNGSNLPSATVDELKATIEGFNINTSMFNTAAKKNTSMDSYSTSQLSMGKSSSDLVGLNLFHSPTNSNTSTPTGTVAAGGQSFGSMMSPTGTGSPSNRHNTATPACAGEDLFDEVGEIVPALPPKQGRLQAPNSRGSTPTLGTIAVPRPPSRKGMETTARLAAASPLTLQSSPAPSANTYSTNIARADSVLSLDFRSGVSTSPTSLSRPGSRSAGPSPLTVSMPSTGSAGAVDSIPLAVAFQEVVHALFRGTDEARCQVRISGDMMLSFPAGLVQLINAQPNHNIPPISFRIRNYQNLENVVPNKQVLNMEQDLMSVEPVFHFNMPQLTLLLKRQAEQNPSASYFNVDILKYQVKAQSGTGSAPLHLVAYWKCEPSQTDVRLDYKFNAHAQVTPAPLRNLMISVPIEGAVTSMQAKPQGEWMGNSNRALWKLPEMSLEADGANMGSIRARFNVSGSSGSPTTITAHFGCDGSTMSGAEMDLVSTGYRTSLVKRRFVAGKYLCEAEASALQNNRYAAPPGPTSTEC
ncbi:F-BAR domain only protein 2-like isoform X2 [Daphnia pulicaria]|uniref:F-BAR domain only protein 2-like isoform X2 n=1 Tax=Daphnia pulicaria TaxID=35523 RepID=UPI001EEBDD40|nr:F-BAR domain only protein 2-like isoform X2 [Daphnia pulicaria]